MLIDKYRLRLQLINEKDLFIPLDYIHKLEIYLQNEEEFFDYINESQNIIYNPKFIHFITIYDNIKPKKYYNECIFLKFILEKYNNKPSLEFVILMKEFNNIISEMKILNNGEDLCMTFISLISNNNIYPIQQNEEIMINKKKRFLLFNNVLKKSEYLIFIVQQMCHNI